MTTTTSVPDAVAWGYAVVEIAGDGTFGRPHLVAAEELATAGGDLLSAMGSSDWSAAATTLVESHAVPIFLLGEAGAARDAVASAVGLAAIGGSDPVLLAAVALDRGDEAAARSALDQMGRRAVEEGAGSLPRRLAAAVAHLCLARMSGDFAIGACWMAVARDLIARLPLPVAEGLHSLSPMLDAHLGSLQVVNGDLHAAAGSLTRGSREASGARARSDCLGQLALLEAFRGNLRQATRHADAVLDSATSPPGSGVVHAQLAQARIHLDRGRLAKTRQRLDMVARMLPGEGEPWLRTNHLLTEARLLTALGQPEAALRLLAGAAKERSPGTDRGWLSDLVVIAKAESLIAAGEPQRALAVLTPVPGHTVVEATVLTAVARCDIGDVRGARATLTTVASDLDGASLGLQVRAWLLEARLAHGQGRQDSAHLLVDRALRAAGTEEMRGPIAQEWGWLRAVVDRDPSLRHDHRGFLASIGPLQMPGHHPVARTGSAPAGGAVVDTLTVREGQVLELLAQMYSTNEIADALYVSANTVKTYLKGIFAKLCVRRRVDAVRRGRELGLC